MFKFLKNRLKKAVEKFSKQAEEEVVEEKVDDKELIEQAKQEEQARAAKRKKATELKDTDEAKAHRAKHEKKPEKPAPKPKKVKPSKQPAKKEEKAPKKEKKTEHISAVEAPLKELAKADEEREREKKKAEKAADEPEELPHKNVRPSEVAITYFVHATTTDNEHHLASGHTAVGLSEKGEQQAKELAQKLKYEFDVLFTSDLKRAKDSAALTWPDKVPVEDKRLRECDYGLYTQHAGKEIEEFIAKHGPEKEFPEGESLEDVEKRIREFLNDLFKKYKGKHVAIVAHRWSQNAIEVLLNDKTWKQAIKSDWRKKKAWQPGWEYTITKPLIEKDEVPPEQTVKEDGTIIEDVTPLEPEVEDREEVLEEELESKEGLEEELEEKKEEERPEASAPEKKHKKFLGIFKKKKKKEVAEPEVVDEPEEVEEIVEEKEEPEEERGEEIKEHETEESEEPEGGFFGKLKDAFTKKQLSEEKFDELFWELELSMLENNVAVEVIEKIKNDLKNALTSGKVSRSGVEQLIIESLRDSIDELFVEPYDLIEKVKKSGKRPYIICFVGVNGSGKTTTLAKVANMFQQNDLSVVMAASDTFRAAAIDQLKAHADRLNIKLISQGYGADPAAVAYDAVEHAKARGIDVVMIDTAGRLHSNTNLMAELEKVVRVAKPDLKIFIGESVTGNDCVEQAKEFDKIVEIDSIILSKADVDEKGGAAISVSYVTGKPILYLGVGQSYGDLEAFDKEKIIESIGL